MATIHNHGPLTLGALADIERVAPPSITKTWLTARIHTLEPEAQASLAAALDALDVLIAGEEPT